MGLINAFSARMPGPIAPPAMAWPVLVAHPPTFSIRLEALTALSVGRFGPIVIPATLLSVPSVSQTTLSMSQLAVSSARNNGQIVRPAVVLPARDVILPMCSIAVELLSVSFAGKPGPTVIPVTSPNALFAMLISPLTKMRDASSAGMSGPTA